MVGLLGVSQMAVLPRSNIVAASRIMDRRPTLLWPILMGLPGRQTAALFVTAANPSKLLQYSDIDGRIIPKISAIK